MASPAFAALTSALYHGERTTPSARAARLTLSLTNKLLPQGCQHTQGPTGDSTHFRGLRPGEINGERVRGWGVTRGALPARGGLRLGEERVVKRLGPRSHSLTLSLSTHTGARGLTSALHTPSTPLHPPHLTLRAFVPTMPASGAVRRRRRRTTGWCKGSTGGFGPPSPGSTPGPVAILNDGVE